MWSKRLRPLGPDFPAGFSGQDSVLPTQGVEFEFEFEFNPWSGSFDPTYRMLQPKKHFLKVWDPCVKSVWHFHMNMGEFLTNEPCYAVSSKLSAWVCGRILQSDKAGVQTSSRDRHTSKRPQGKKRRASPRAPEPDTPFQRYPWLHVHRAHQWLWVGRWRCWDI